MIAVLCGISGMAAMVIAIFGRSLGEVGVMMVLVVWGAGALTFFGLCVAHAIDRTPKGKIPQVMSGLLFIWAGGSIVGPLLSGIAMRGAGATGLFGLSGLLLILLALIMVWRVSAPARGLEPDPANASGQCGTRSAQSGPGSRNLSPDLSTQLVYGPAKTVI